MVGRILVGRIFQISLLLSILTLTPHGQDFLEENQVIGYRRAGSNDVVARLQQKLNRGEVRLEYDETTGYLTSVLKQLGVLVSSQGLVFSKTSFQLHRITPSNPRAIYFGDDVYVGWVRGGDVLELAAVDPQLGGVFYALEQVKTERPRFVRHDECLQCHASNGTRNVPGFVVRSVYPDDRGYPIAPLGSHVTSHTSPLIQRWGGWYVTGSVGSARHAGNMLFDESTDPEKPEQLAGTNLMSLERKFSPTGYLSAHSDIVALMVLEHQTQMHNLFTRLNYETKLALENQRVMDEALQRRTEGLSDSARRRIEQAARDVVHYMLFIGDARWESPITGTTSFAKEFVATGPRDKQGRSLRDLDLKTRLFRYPCSFLIYSEAFDALPKQALDEVYRQLWLALSGQPRERDYLLMPAEEKRAILEILRETKPNLPKYYSPGS